MNWQYFLSWDKTGKTLNRKPIQKTHWPWIGSWKMLPYFGVLAHDWLWHSCVLQIFPACKWYIEDDTFMLQLIYGHHCIANSSWQNRAVFFCVDFWSGVSGVENFASKVFHGCKAWELPLLFWIVTESQSILLPCLLTSLEAFLLQYKYKEECFGM